LAGATIVPICKLVPAFGAYPEPPQFDQQRQGLDLRRVAFLLRYLVHVQSKPERISISDGSFHLSRDNPPHLDQPGLLPIAPRLRQAADVALPLGRGPVEHRKLTGLIVGDPSEDPA
jgi:hypothetical protein